MILTTTASREEAERLGRTLVEEKLAACATIVTGAKSIYRWQGEIETAEEIVLLLKTLPDQLPALEARLHALHSYQTPEFLVLRMESASAGYLEWLADSLEGS